MSNRQMRRAMQQAEKGKGAPRRKVRVIFPNPVQYAIDNVKPVEEALPEYAANQGLRLHLAYEALTKGQATKGDIADLMEMGNILEALTILKVLSGAEQAIKDSEQALFDIVKRQKKTGKILGTGPELMAVRTLMDYHDAAAPEVSLHNTVRALKLRDQMVAKGDSRPINMEEK